MTESDSMYAKTVSCMPTLEYYQRTYASNMDNNDQKAVSAFREYESHEKLRRLQTELQWLKNEQVIEKTCIRIIGKKRKGKYGSYARWATLMLMWCVSKRT